MSSEGVTSKKGRRLIAGILVVGLAAATFGLTTAFASSSSSSSATASDLPSTTPIKHLVVIFQENESFDHYFGTYPNATNPAGEPAFTASPGTPSVNGLGKALLTSNPNSANPQRLDRSEALTCDQGHGYGAEQKAFDGGLMDKFVQFTAGGSCADKSIVMDYYDGNTVTGLWNYAQHFAMSDDSFDTQFGPSTVGALNLISGQTHGATPTAVSGSVENGSVIGDPESALDDCGTKSGITMSGKNVGDLLNEHKVTWGWFQGGFEPTETKEGRAVCGSGHANIGNATVSDYVAHHNPFEYYASTANPHHLPPSSNAMIGHSDQANHEYDMSDFDIAVAEDNLPAVSFLKAPAYENGHPGNSDPLDEQRFLAEKINELEHSPQWASMAVVIAYDDSDGWYDHVMPTIVNPSKSASDALNGTGECGHVSDESAYQDRCGYGPRLPLLVISPYAKQNYVDGTQTDQSSILKFVEDNWQLGRIGDQSMDAKAGTLGNMFDFDAGATTAPKVFLDPSTGQVVGGGSGPEGSGSGGSGSGSGGGSGRGSGKHHQRMRCAVSGHDRRVQVRCSVSGGGKGRGAVRFRVDRGSRVLGTGRTPLSGGEANASIPTTRALAGDYTLLASVDRRDGVTALSQAVTLPGHEVVRLH